MFKKGFLNLFKYATVAQPGTAQAWNLINLKSLQDKQLVSARISRFKSQYLRRDGRVPHCIRNSPSKL